MAKKPSSKPASSKHHLRSSSNHPDKRKKKEKKKKMPVAPPEDEDVEVGEEDHAFVDEYYNYSAGFLESNPLEMEDEKAQKPARLNKDQQQDQQTSTKRKRVVEENGGIDEAEAAIEAKDTLALPSKSKKNRAAINSEEDAHVAGEKLLRRKASTQGWDTTSTKSGKERLPIKTIDGKLHARMDGDDDEEEEEQADEGQGEKDEEIVQANGEMREQEKDDKMDEEGEAEEEEEEGEDDDDVYDSADDDQGPSFQKQALPTDMGEMTGKFSEAAAGLRVDAFGGDMRALRRARLELKKVEIATTCEAILEDPEAGFMSRMGGGTTVSKNGAKSKIPGRTKMGILLSLLEDGDVKIQSLAMLSLLAVFRDVLPAYRIRLPTDKELATKVSKEVKKTRDYEKALLGAYQVYLKHLERASKRGDGHGKGSSVEAAMAAKCLCEVLTSLSHFNFTTNVLAAVVRLGLGKASATRAIAAQAVKRLLDRDQQGEVSLTATRMICKEIKVRQFHTPDDMVRALSALRLRVKEDEADDVIRRAKAEDRRRGGGKDERRKKGGGGQGNEEEGEEGQGDILAGLREAEARADPVLRAKYQAETLQEVTLLYFRVLKQAKRPTLLPAVLKGLSRVAHLINLDTVVDLLDVLKDLLDSQRNLPLEACLHAVLTALRTLQGPGRELKVDDKDFIGFLYQQLLRIAQRNGSSHLPLLVTCLRAALVERRELSVARVAALYKRLAALTLHLPAKEARVALALVKDLGQRYTGLEQLLDGDSDRMAMGVYRPDALEPEMSNPLAAGAWELSLLKLHQHPAVRKTAQAALVAGGGEGQGGGRYGRPRDPLETMKEMSEIEKKGFGGMFVRLPRVNPLHGMVKKAEREKKGHRMKLYFIQRITIPLSDEKHLLEGVPSLSSSFQAEDVLSSLSADNDEEGGSRFKKMYKEHKRHARRYEICMEVARTKAILKAHQQHSFSASSSQRKAR